MAGTPATRSQLRRALVHNALAKQINVAVPVAILAACAILGVAWLAGVALLCWLALAATTFFDEGEARRVGERVRAARARDRPAPRPALDPALRRRLRAATDARRAIREALGPGGDIAREVDGLVAALETDAARAQRIVDLLGEESPADLERRLEEEARAPMREALTAKQRALVRLEERLNRLLTGMDRAVTVLQTVHAEILAAQEAERGLEERALTSRVSELRIRAQVMASEVDDALAETGRLGAS